jgi:hypothetical protein
MIRGQIMIRRESMSMEQWWNYDYKALRRGTASVLLPPGTVPPITR